MKIASPISADQPVGVSPFDDGQEMGCFRDAACAAAIWNRRLPSEVTAWLAGLDAALLPSGRAVMPVSAVTENVTQLCDMAGMPIGPQRDWLIDDIADLAHRFAEVMNAPYVKVRLQAVTTNACRKFHLDAITGRLVCTYRGSGTQYGTSAKGGDPEHIFATPTGAPIVLRGSLWPATPSAGLLHRSPPIEGTGETRLVLVLDPASETDITA